MPYWYVMRIIYVSAEKAKSVLVEEVEKLGHTVVVSDPSLSGVESAPDVILVELDGEVSAASSYWREQGVPLLGVLKDGVPARALGKVDDFLLEGATRKEIELRLEVAMIRAGQAAEDVIRADGLSINVANYEVTLDGEILDLTYKEFELLKFLATNRGRVITRDVLLDRVWGYDYIGGTRTVDVHIRRLRAKLGRYESLIETVRNVGYRFKR